MTEKTALEWLKVLNSWTMLRDEPKKACEMAINALEKQIAEKVIVWADNTEHCPYCEKDLTALGYLKHCNDCGQKLDWSEVQE